MDTLNNQDNQALSINKDSQINLVVNRPIAEDVMEIDLARVFHTMKKKRRVFAWLVLLCFTVGICAPLLLYQFNKQPLTVSSVVTLKYQVGSSQVKDLTAPDGKQLDLNQITSSYVLHSALDGLALSQPVALTDLRDNIKIDRILTDDSRRQQEVASRMIDDKNSGAYTQVKNIDLTYINSFVVSLTNGFGTKKTELTNTELRLVLDRVMAAYNDYLVTTYADVKLPDDEFSAIDINTLEIQESLDQLRTAVQNLYDFCSGKSAAIRTYRSWRTGLSLQDLMAQLETVRNVDVDYLYSYVYSNSISRSRDALITTYQYQLRNAQTRLDSINENIVTNQQILSTYKNDEIFVSMQESDAAKTTKTTTDYYNRLILEQANNYDRVAKLETQISDLTDKLVRLNESANSVANAADLEAAAQELSATVDLCHKTYDQICAQLTEIFDSPSFTTYAEHSAAQGKTASFLSANMKKMLIGGVAGAVVACGFWFLAGIAPEFKYRGKEEIEGKEVAR